MDEIDTCIKLYLTLETDIPFLISAAHYIIYYLSSGNFWHHDAP